MLSRETVRFNRIRQRAPIGLFRPYQTRSASIRLASTRVTSLRLLISTAARGASGAGFTTPRPVRFSARRQWRTAAGSSRVVGAKLVEASSARAEGQLGPGALRVLENVEQVLIV